ncbi:MAG: 2,3,4,5-tetrahydropyridine-2,6-dicarboxylate N-succinyltransferase [Bdellovibrio sp. CG12_big_fil_rev_8_21_14_0_65_39_13]|nr:MAG: 2,3,4,5-tetrahydropyridine-2,6-dicarboxylate N-succinyltransferase [Bdellovibrio sp. CG22_combo_CG10-13_8_21_14_all_39_27]PIQ58395.1 MAG: 2,3,4,5-tetrahydropyridine-2,6-dicarboxylate N-succinyltransferase [Bdellovibrio sp. CG12_big_fil_rev_8_21_14_0_65_39_13]PIR35908.1 MAG: 2,3,4,5-tetrahydropyridine-2,6-dicarboxylate N-succinyltransferase [Bdellovibrio sp. CG11_big_fil_rev_8_21_14_0_20_39_38]PJB53581.1 MAG: 2,3,4,5-tetrahydropyridine-2,6-dicarboxylate N-succinyltransferase [Bdellovibrio
MNWENVLNELEKGTLRSAHCENGVWKANVEVKQAILAAFKAGELKEFNGFVDKHNLMPQQFDVSRGVRVVPGGTSIRRGSFVAKGVIVMPPAYINIGAYVDEGTMIDSHALVGSCAQIGKRVHLSAGVQIGGVLEPVGLAPVIIEDDVFVGAGSVIVEGIVVRRRAVIAPGVILSKAVPVYDAVSEKVLPRGSEIPEGAVVVPGSRPISPDLKWANKNGLQLGCAIIIKYRDEKSDASLVLEEYLR